MSVLGEACKEKVDNKDFQEAIYRCVRSRQVSYALEDSFKKSKAAGAVISPTIVINGEHYCGPKTPTGLASTHITIATATTNYYQNNSADENITPSWHYRATSLIATTSILPMISMIHRNWNQHLQLKSVLKFRILWIIIFSLETRNTHVLF